jgi:hypothetical protein
LIVAKSRVRKKQVYTAPPSVTPEKKAIKVGSPMWLVPAMVSLFLFGLLWIVLYYIAGPNIPGMKTLGWWNIIVGFGFIGGGFMLSTKWR